MEKPYFVMLNTQNGECTPMTEGDGGIALYADQSEARIDAENNMLGKAFGYEVFERGTGET